MVAGRLVASTLSPTVFHSQDILVATAMNMIMNMSSQQRWLIWLLLAGVFCCYNVPRSAASAIPKDYLTQDSVVMITGAAGVLGSELALALFRTYDVKRVVCVDRLLTPTNTTMTQKQLALLESQRQRAFRILQTLGDRASFYRVDFRPMIPEYFDIGEVSSLHHIFRTHPDITHIGRFQV
jgi:hypothetical protein